MTPGERRLWAAIRRKQVMGYRFQRQRPIGPFIVDFYCKELRLALEVDGSSHDGKWEYDQIRQKKIELKGVKFLRFTEGEARRDTQGVVWMIEQWIIDYTSQ